MKSLIKLIFGDASLNEEKIESNLQKHLNEYNGKLEISQYFVLSKSYEVFYYSEYSYKTPNKILEKFKRKTVIWLDDTHNLLGFSNDESCLLFNLDEVKSFSITNILPAKLSGASFLNIQLIHEKQAIQLTTSTPKDFDGYAEGIHEMSKIDVIFEREFYDC
ncbi:MAG: hypothetical protein P0Y62_13180 [Candidatus Chryseobacterium colombiense]|nr:hypothetical protein [Chryseobacterium sp.]WEK68797.1 MAG: hypothetical protein P0Y62_13180 [Chryseobacterium sp.]